MGKNLNTDSMDKLFSGLVRGSGQQEESQVAEPEAVVPVVQDKQKKTKTPMERVCTIVDSNDMSKIRTIAENEGIAIKDIIALGLTLAINKYEELHGKIRVKKSKKGDVDAVFNVKG